MLPPFGFSFNKKVFAIEHYRKKSKFGIVL